MVFTSFEELIGERMRLKSATDLDGELWAVPVAGSTRLNGSTQAKVPGLGYSCLRGQEGTMLSD